MAFRRFRSHGRGFGRGFRRHRANRYEIAQVSFARVGLETGLSSISVPDQFFQPIATFRDWMAGEVRVLNPGALIARTEPAHSGKTITVRGLQFDYQYSAANGPGSEGNNAIGVCSIRTAVVVLDVAAPAAGDDESGPIPKSPPPNILFNTQTLRYNNQFGFNPEQMEPVTRVRTLWRGMDMLSQGINTDPLIMGDWVVPKFQTQSRHVRVRTSATLGPHQGLFLVTEIVNPFLEDNPVIGLDLLGSCVIKTNFAGRMRYDTQFIE